MTNPVNPQQNGRPSRSVPSGMPQKRTVRRKIDPVKKKHKKINNAMIVLMLVVSLITIGAFAFNIYKVVMKKSAATGTTLSTDTGTSMKNDQYTIGNNPTDVEQKYFQELTDAVNSGDEAKTADAVVKCFISDYFTWTNKDGNYEVGGLQYVYQQKRGVLETQSRWTFYGDLDLYISQYGRANLLQVKDITTGGATKTDDFVVKAVTPEETLPCYYVEAHWTYENSSKIDVDSFQKQGAFYVGKTSSGRMEIVAFYDTIGGSDSTATESTSAAQEG